MPDGRVDTIGAARNICKTNQNEVKTLGSSKQRTHIDSGEISQLLPVEE
jgi:hypothetical protein